MNWIGSSNRQIFREKLYIPYAGLRNYNSASPDQGSYTYLWSSSPYGTYSRGLYLNNFNLTMFGSLRANGIPVRCFYDSSSTVSQSFTLTFGVSDDNGSTSAETGSVASGTVIVLSTGDFEATKDGWTHL